jgi:hypothetical protein
MFIRGIGEDYRSLPLSPKSVNVLGRVLDVKVRAYGRLLLHEAEVPVRDVVMIQPLDGLPSSRLVKVFDEEAMSDDTDANIGRR